MPSFRVYAGRLLFIALLSLSLCAQLALGQQKQPPQESADDVVRVTTELVQTDVTVVDKQGRFVDGLQLEQFELRVDGKPQPVSFFERVTAGSSVEEERLAAARGGAPATPRKAKDNSGSSIERGRTIIFYIDDLHLKFDSLNRVKKSLLSFINNELGLDDTVAIASATGRIGFLQQFTNDKTVLRAAVARLQYKSYDTRDGEIPPMAEHQALSIDLGDSSVTDYYVDVLIRENPMMTRRVAEELVKTRARNILQQAANVTASSLGPLEGLMRIATGVPGRKLVFFISDGFLLDSRNSTVHDRLRKITGAAGRAGVVIYSMDAKGLVTGMPDASEQGAVDTTGRLARASIGEAAASQDPLFTLALDTGGRAFVNSNALAPGIRQALTETSDYYLLAWRPDPETQRGGKYRKLEVKVIGHPEWTVHARRGFIVEEAKKDSKSKKQKKAAKSPDADLNAALGDLLPRKALPVFLNVSYIDTPEKGGIAYSAVQLDSTALSFDSSNGEQTAVVDLLLAILNDQGKQVHSFKDHLSIAVDKTEATDLDRHSLGSNYQVQLAPGLYQVRTAVREEKSGRIGSAIQWIEIPDLTKRRLAMSSLLIAERKMETGLGEAKENQLGSNAASPVRASTNRRVASTSRLRFVTFVYNASRGPSGNAAPDVALQIQLFRNDQPILVNPLRKVSTKDVQDFSRLPYAAEIPLNGLPAGRYVLVVIALDQTARSNTTQRIDFMVQ
ncbi:MAG TPA: VWA domain-containing protein [Pyrinomonadaceae bacterium]|jgi:VWFA-related protein